MHDACSACSGPLVTLTRTRRQGWDFDRDEKLQAHENCPCGFVDLRLSKPGCQKLFLQRETWGCDNDGVLGQSCHLGLIRHGQRCVAEYTTSIRHKKSDSLRLGRLRQCHTGITFEHAWLHSVSTLDSQGFPSHEADAVNPDGVEHANIQKLSTICAFAESSCERESTTWCSKECREAAEPIPGPNIISNDSNSTPENSSNVSSPRVVSPPRSPILPSWTTCCRAVAGDSVTFQGVQSKLWCDA